MELKRFDVLTGLRISDADQDTQERYKAWIAAAEIHVNELCGNKFLLPQPDGSYQLVFPPDVEIGITQLVVHMSNWRDGNIASQSLSGMSQSFFQGGGYITAAAYWKRFLPGNRVRYI